jgi:hypothetical protein
MILQGYWQTIGYLLAQLHGLADGYEAQRADIGQQLTVEAPCDGQGQIYGYNLW